MWFYDGQDRVTGENSENPPVMNQFGSGDIVKLLDNLFSETVYDLRFLPSVDPGAKHEANEGSVEGLQGVFAERLAGLSNLALSSEIVSIILERSPLGLDTTNEWSIATINWLLTGGYESTPREPFTGDTQWSILDIPVQNEADALSILAGIVINTTTSLETAGGTDSLQYQLWRLGILEEVEEGLIPLAPPYEPNRQKNYWYAGISPGTNPGRLQLLGHELGQEVTDLTNVWLDAEHYTDNWPQSQGTDNTSVDQYSAAGFPVPARSQAITRLIWLTTDWDPSSTTESFNSYMRDKWRWLGLISPETAAAAERDY